MLSLLLLLDEEVEGEDKDRAGAPSLNACAKDWVMTGDRSATDRKRVAAVSHLLAGLTFGWLFWPYPLYGIG